MTTTRDHIDHIMEVMEAAFDPAYGEAWNRRQVTDALTMPSTHALIIDTHGELIDADPADPAGFVLTRAAAGEEELLLIAVKPELRTRGLGKGLIEKLFDVARARGTERIFLEMRRGNPAIHLYRKVGFEPIGERPNYYRMVNGDRVDAITFGCSI
jgi:ribosomal-protein-alanine N-acetyltransferase